MSIRNTCIGAIAVLLILCASQGVAQEADIPGNLTLQDAIRLAIEGHPLLAAAKNEIRAAEGDRISAGKRPNPVFSLQIENLPIPAPAGPFFNTQEITSRLDFEIERGGRRQLRMDAATHALEAQTLAYQDQVRLLRLQVQKVFYQTVLAKLNLETSKSILEQAEQMIALNRIRYEQGDISELDLKRIEVEKLRFQDDVFLADLALQNARSTLLALLNARDLSQTVDVIGGLPVIDPAAEQGLPPQAPLEDLIRMALDQRPDLAMCLRDTQRADSEAKLQKAMRSSNLTIGGGYKRNMNENSLVFGIAIPLKIFDRNEGERIRADAGIMRASYLAAALTKEIQRDVRKARSAADINRQRVDYLRTQQVKIAEDARRVTLESYNLGGTTLIDFLDAQRTYRDALRLFNQALFEERISLYELSSSIALGVQK